MMIASPAPPILEEKTSPRAIWSLILGILSMTCLWLLGSIPSIILGILALKEIENSGGTVKGREFGIAGIITGSAGVFVGLAPIALVAAIALPAFSGVQQKAQSAKQMSDIRQLIYACKAYAVDNNGSYPAELPILLADGYIHSGDLLEWRSGRSAATGEPYLYRRGLTDSLSGEEALIAAAQPLSGTRNVGYTDGSVSAVPEEEFQSVLASKFDPAG